MPVFVDNVRNIEEDPAFPAHGLPKDAANEVSNDIKDMTLPSIGTSGSTETTVKTTTEHKHEKPKEGESSGEGIYVNIMYLRVLLSFFTSITVKLLMS